MKQFLRNIAAFTTLPIALVVALEVFAPSTWFTFRSWEAGIPKVGRLFNGPFYPHLDFVIVEQGDLAHHTRFAIDKHVTWKTDELGFRNERFIPDADVLLIGDSNVTGSSLSQEETLAAVVREQTGLPVYSLAPASVNRFADLHQAGVIKAPKIVVLCFVERNLPGMSPIKDIQSVNHLALKRNSVFQFVAVKLDRIMRANSVRCFRARARGAVGSGRQSDVDERMFFTQSTKAALKLTDDQLKQVVESLISYRAYCDSLGCEFVFCPIPNKQTIYWELAGLKEQPTFVNKVIQAATGEKILVIDTMKLFNRLKANGVRCYQYDDTHWNTNAIQAVAGHHQLKAVVRVASKVQAANESSR